MKESWLANFMIAGVVAALLAIAPSAGKAASYPTRTIEGVAPFGAGSLVDRILLMMIPYLEKDLGQKILPNYKSGAGGSIGTAWLAKANPDGSNPAPPFSRNIPPWFGRLLPACTSGT